MTQVASSLRNFRLLLLIRAGFLSIAVLSAAQSINTPSPVVGAPSIASLEPTRSGTRDRAQQLMQMRLQHPRIRGNRNVEKAGSKTAAPSTIAAPANMETPGAFRIETQSGPKFAPDGEPVLPLWTYDIVSPRDGYHYRGNVVGRDPFKNSGSAQIPTIVIPIVVQTQTVATSVDPATGTIIATEPGVTTLNPVAHDSVCLSAPNDVPSTLVAQSPVFTATQFSFGSTNIGTTQFVDAFQRANFWRAQSSEGPGKLHVLLDPVRFVPPVMVKVPPSYGLALKDGNILGPPAFCAPYGVVDFYWFDNYLTSNILPSLAKQGLDPATLPIFLTYNMQLTSGAGVYQPVFSYHYVTGGKLPIQTYVVANFDTSGVFVDSKDIGPMASAIADWMNDPFYVGGAFNTAPLWNFPLPGFPAVCESVSEPSSPLDYFGNNTTLLMPNGFTYNLPEMTFTSWFFGGQSFGVNGWLSSNNTVVSAAGPPCVE